MDAGTAGVLTGSLMVLANIVVQQATIAAAYGVLPPNGRVGIRNDATLAGPTAWRTAHRAALPLIGVGTLIGVALAVVAVVLADDGRSTESTGLTLASAVLLGVTVVGAERRARTAVRGARRDDTDPRP